MGFDRDTQFNGLMYEYGALLAQSHKTWFLRVYQTIYLPKWKFWIQLSPNSVALPWSLNYILKLHYREVRVNWILIEKSLNWVVAMGGSRRVGGRGPDPLGKSQVATCFQSNWNWTPRGWIASWGSPYGPLIKKKYSGPPWQNLLDPPMIATCASESGLSFSCKCSGSVRT